MMSEWLDTEAVYFAVHDWQDVSGTSNGHAGMLVGFITCVNNEMERRAKEMMLSWFCVCECVCVSVRGMVLLSCTRQAPG
jgi:hypothetical protein